MKRQKAQGYNLRTITEDIDSTSNHTVMANSKIDTGMVLRKADGNFTESKKKKVLFLS